MKLNIAYPANGSQKKFEVDDVMAAQRLFVDKRLGAEVAIDSLGPEWAGYIVRINGGNDKQGFPMKQGVLTNTRVRLLLRKGHSCYRPRRDGERKRKSVHGCIVSQSIGVLCLSIVKKGEGEIPGLTDVVVPRRLGPKRASKIRKLFNLSKKDDVRSYAIRRPLPLKEGQKKAYVKAPKIQRLITPLMLQHKRKRMAEKRKRAERRTEEQREYAQLLAKRQKEKTEKVKEAKEKRKKQLANKASVSSMEGGGSSRASRTSSASSSRL